MQVNSIGTNNIAFKSGYPTFGSNGHLSLKSGYPTFGGDSHLRIYGDDPRDCIGIYFKPTTKPTDGLLNIIA